AAPPAGNYLVGACIAGDPPRSARVFFSIPRRLQCRLLQMLVVIGSIAATSSNAQVSPVGTDPNCSITYEDSLPRRRPGREMQDPDPCAAEGLRPAVWNTLPDFAAVPDRWRIVSGIGYAERLWDPYNGNNVLKGDRPVFGKDWFFALNVISDSTFEARSLPTPVAAATSPGPGALDVLGVPDQTAFTQNLIVETVVYKGDTVFRPPDLEFRFIPVFNLSSVQVDEAGVLKADTTADLTRTEGFVGIQGLFVDKHLRNVSERYDFDSLRIGIQPITADFRGFLFQDSPVGVRLFGNRNNNLWQYNVGWFRRLEKDSNSGLNDITETRFSDALRDDDVFLFNLYRQDFPFIGFTSQAVLVHNANREMGENFVDDNGFLGRPSALGVQKNREYDVTYAGLNGDGHIGKWNLTLSAYFAFGKETPATFADLESDIRAFFAAGEVSRDFDWIRLRGTFVYGSGDDDPYDDVSSGFDAIFENPLIAGADSSFWIRQAVPLIGGGRVTLSSQNGLLNSMRSSKQHGQSNFTNPGIVLLGGGADFDITPKWRASINVNQLWFDETAVLEAARNQGSLASDIGQDLSLSVIYRPLTSQNIILRVSASALLPGKGYKDLYDSDTPYSVLANLVLSY
ncbi:MAG: hypothetical protein OEY72_14940, partial [Gammaproteobacteria bacterium]|nr:hypothetical protein [Gammaproteobacteria bacterium]